MRFWKGKAIGIRSERLFLTPLRVSDAVDVLAWVNNEEIVRNFQFFTGAIGIEEEENYIVKILKSPSDLLLGLFFDGCDGYGWQLVGTCGLHDIDFDNDTARLGVIVGKKEHWGKSYAEEAIRALVSWAFLEMNLHKIYLNVFVTNERGIHLYTNVGFKIEGALRKEYKIRDEYIDMFRMAILKEEWNNGKAN